VIVVIAWLGLLSLNDISLLSPFLFGTTHLPSVGGAVAGAPAVGLLAAASQFLFE
jgi:hypothetical protein